MHGLQEIVAMNRPGAKAPVNTFTIHKAHSESCKCVDCLYRELTPVVVVDEESASNPGERFAIVKRFQTVAEAEAYIGSLPDRDKVARGGYGIDAPESTT